MTWLKRVGQILAAGVEIVTGLNFQAMFPSSAQGAIGTVVNDLQQIQGVIVSVEAAANAVSAAGPQKLLMAAPLVAQIIMQSSLMAGHKIDNQALFTQAATEIAQGMADLLNSLKDNVESSKPS